MSESNEAVIASSSAAYTPVKISKFLDALVPVLKPPVGNRVWFQGTQFFAMIVAGPNVRDDFHYQPGEELFFMLKGDMNLDVMEDEKGRRRIPIAQDQMYLLPKLTHHSPQRYANTIGLVFERIRKPDDVDYLKWFAPQSTEVLYEEHFHCADINNALQPIIKRFLATPHAETLKSVPKSDPEVSGKFAPNVMSVTEAMGDAVKAAAGSLKASKAISGEFEVEFYCGAGATEISLNSSDTFLLQYKGSATLSFSGEGAPAGFALNADEAAFLPILAGGSATISTTDAAACLMIVTCTMP